MEKRVTSHGVNSAHAHENTAEILIFGVIFQCFGEIISLSLMKTCSLAHCTFRQMRKSAQREGWPWGKVLRTSWVTQAASGRLIFSYGVFSHAEHMVPFPVILPSSASKHTLGQIHPW